MITIGMWMIFLSFIFWIGAKCSWSIVNTKGFLWLIVLGGLLSIIAIEAGWWMAEVGRQPWVLRGILRTADAATSSEQVDEMLLLFSGLYLILGIGTIVVLCRMFRKNPVEQELEDREADKGGEIT